MRASASASASASVGHYSVSIADLKDVSGVEHWCAKIAVTIDYHHSLYHAKIVALRIVAGSF